MIAYIPRQKNFYSTDEYNTKFNKQEKTYRLQQLYTAALSSLKHYQQKDMLNNVKLQLGNKSKIANLTIPVMFIIGDNQGGGGICGQHIHYGKTARQISQTCNAGPNRTLFDM